MWDMVTVLTTDNRLQMDVIVRLQEQIGPLLAAVMGNKSGRLNVKYMTNWL